MSGENQMCVWMKSTKRVNGHCESWLAGRRYAGRAKRRGVKEEERSSGAFVRKADGAEACAALPVSTGLSDQSLTAAKHTSVESMQTVWVERERRGER
jgi:hypothetical protein